MRAWLVLIAILVAGCGPSPEQQAADGRDRAGSWAAGIKAAIEAWDAGLVPPHYVASTLDAAAQDLIAQEQPILKQSGAAAARPLDSVIHAVPQLQDAVSRGDREGARKAASALSQSVPPPPPPPSVQAVR